MCHRICQIQGLRYQSTRIVTESRKIAKYSALDFSLYNLVPIAIEMLGTFGIKSLKFKDLGKRITLHTSDPLAPFHLV